MRDDSMIGQELKKLIEENERIIKINQELRNKIKILEEQLEKLNQLLGHNYSGG
jgi:hypothetical protein